MSDDCQKYRVNFTVDALGSHFVKDGKMYHLDSQELQGKQAYRSGASKDALATNVANTFFSQGRASALL